MKLKPQNTYKHLLNFASNDNVRPILNGFHFTNEGHIEATNAHVLLRLLNRVPAGNEMVLHPKELREIEGNYPDTSRLIPLDFKTTYRVTPETAAAVGKFLKALDKKSIVTLAVSEKELVITETSAKATQAFEVSGFSGDAVELVCRTQYLGFMMAFIADCSPVSADVKVISPVRPMVFELPGSFVGLVTPVMTK